ncbi:OmpH family outer membrane protein [Dendrosporobacter sp. 1207_IL3150]|uniref:OmpH family outer membrane protein n=1 Tax=Dendrosporobacter sp. 1207_IL3150 TaxID=3084054 RepID=UPI002FD98D36
MLKLEKKQIKLITLVITVFFVLGIVGIAVSQSGKSYAAAAGSSSNVGVVNHQMLVSQHPDMAKAQAAMQAEVEQAKKDFDAKSASMGDKEKQDYYMQLQQRLNLKQQELIAPVFDKVDAAIKAVADAKGLSVVMDKSNVVYGGQDITDEVAKKFTSK